MLRRLAARRVVQAMTTGALLMFGAHSAVADSYAYTGPNPGTIPTPVSGNFTGDFTDTTTSTAATQPPSGTPPDQLTFAGTAAYTATDDLGALSLFNLTFSNSVGLVTIAAGANTPSFNLIANGGVNPTLNVTGNGGATIAVPVTLANAATFTNSGTGILTVSGTVGDGGNVLTVQGTGNTAISGVISGTGGGITKNGTGTLTLSQIEAFTTPTVALNGGTLLLDGSGSAFTTATQLVLPTTTVLNVGGGTLNYKTGLNVTIVPVFATLNVNAGGTIFTQTLTTGRLVEEFNTVNRVAGGTLDMTIGGGSTSDSFRLPTSTNINGVTPWATYTSGSTFYVAAGTGTNGAGYAAYTNSTATTLGTSTQNVDILTDVAVPTASTVNTLRFNNNANSHTLTVSSGDTLTLTAGGILITNGFANHRAAINGGTLTVATTVPDLIVIDNDNPTNGTSATFTIGSTIADSNPGTVSTALTKSGIGTLILSNAANTYSGSTYLNGGITQIAADGSLGATTNSLVFSGGTLQLSPTFSGTSLSSRGITLNDLGGTIDTNGASISYGGTIAAGTGVGGFTKAGAGILTLSAANSYAGTTTINAGNIALGTGTSTVGSGAVNVNSGAALSGVGTAPGAVTINGGGILAPGNNTNAAGTSGGTAGTLTVGSLNLASASSTLDFDLTSGSTTAASSVNDLVKVNGVLTITGGQFNFTGAATSTGGGVVYDLFQYGSLVGNVSSLTYAGGLSGGLTPVFGTSGNFVTLTVNGSPAQVSAWNVDANGNWSVAANWNPQVVPHNPGDTANFGSVITAPRIVNLNVNETVGIVTFANANAYTIGAGGGTLFLNNNTSSANITDNNGTHFIAAPLTLTSSTNASVANAADTLTISGIINGAGLLTKSGSGTLALSGANSYGPAAGTIGTTLSAGTLQVGSNTALGSGDVSIAAGTLQSGVAGLTLANNMIIGSGATETVDTVSNTLTLNGLISDAGGNGILTLTGSGAGGGTLILAANDTYGGATNISLGETLQLGAGGTAGSVAGAVVDSGTLALNRSDSGFTLGNIISGTGGLTEVAGSATLTGTNTFSGITNITNGTLTLSAAGAGTNSLALQNSTLNFNGGALAFGPNIVTATVAGLTGTVSTQNLALTNSTPAAVTLTVNNSVADNYAGILSGTGNLIKTAAGVLTLSGANTYTGNTTVNAGTLALTGSLGTSGTPTGAITTTGSTLNVNGGTLFGTTLSVNNSTASTVNITNNGAVNLTGTLAIDASNGSLDGLVSLVSGTLTANAVTIGRGNENKTGTLVLTETALDGLYVNGGTANITTTLSVGSAATAENSSANMRIDSGTVNVGGTTTVTNDASTRYSVLDVNGGTFNSLNGSGIVLGGNADTAGPLAAELLVSNTGTLNTNSVTFGGPNQASGIDVFEAIGGTSYIGAGGLVSGGPTGTTAITVALGNATVATAPIIAASANWSSSLNVTLTNNSGGASPTIQTADSSNVAHNITLSGTLSGTGGFVATGGGVLTLMAPNSYSGGTTITAGTVAVNTSIAAGSGTSAVGSGTVTFAGGTLQNANLTSSNASNTQTIAGAASPTTGTSSNLDFGAGNTGAVFSFASLDTTNTGFLYIKNWTGLSAGGGTDQLFFGTTQAYTNAQLQNVVFNGANGTPGLTGASQLSSGEIVSNGIAAAPEPSQFVAFGLGVLGLGGLTLRARRRSGQTAQIS